jgi:hypothetical protein
MSAVAILQNPIDPKLMDRFQASFKSTPTSITCESRRPLEAIAEAWLADQGRVSLADLIFGAMCYGASIRRRDELAARLTREWSRPDASDDLDRDHMHAPTGGRYR